MFFGNIWTPFWRRVGRCLRVVMVCNVPFLSLKKLALLFLIVCGLLYNHKLSSSSDDVATTDTGEKSSQSLWKHIEIMEALDPRLFDTSIQLPDSHPLENSCKYPVLQTEDLNIADYIEHKRHMTCKKVLSDIVSFVDGVLYVNQAMALKEFNNSVICMHRPYAGSLRPWITMTFHYSSWMSFTDKTNGKIIDDQFEVKCFIATDVNRTNAVYRNSFAQVGDKQLHVPYLPNDETTLSLDIIGLDSTSFNMFRRHMPKSWNYLKNTMEAFHLEGYNKVADNSMVNWLPVFTGLRYGNQSDDMPSDYKTYGEPLNLEKVPWLWNDFRDKGCVTMLNDDPMHFTRGLFHYPWEEAVGFKLKPTDHYFRPWHVYHRQWPIDDASPFCFNNHAYYKLQLNLVEQMIQRYKNSCHFSFSFFTDITHDDPNNLELMDDTVKDFLERSYLGGYLNNTVLVLMGDHGHRISAIQYTYVGRIEERASFFSIYFPKWFRDKHPDIMKNLKYNKHRLSSNYDVHQMLKDIVNGKFDSKPDERSTRGTSLFQKLPSNRTCDAAEIPENHCLCMESVPKPIDKRYLELSERVIFDYTMKKLKIFRKCHSLLKVKILSSSVWTTSQMIQHGVRHQIPEFLDRLKTRLEGYVQYYEIEYQLLPTNITAVIRLQYDKWFVKLFVNVPPLPTSGVSKCSTWSNLETFCACSSFSKYNKLF